MLESLLLSLSCSHLTEYTEQCIVIFTVLFGHFNSHLGTEWCILTFTVPSEQFDAAILLDIQNSAIISEHFHAAILLNTVSIQNSVLKSLLFCLSALMQPIC